MLMAPISRLTAYRLEGEALAAPSPETRVTIAGSIRRRDQLVRDVRADVLMAPGPALVSFRRWHTRASSLADVQGRAIATEHLHRRPFWQHWDRRRCVRREFFPGMNHLAADDGEN